MVESYYLPEGHILGGHYEIVKVLGEDEFEILYLVKDTHRLGSLFVIKEFFLKSYASREENNSVKVKAKSKILFEETKKEMIEEITAAQKNTQSNHVQTYGYLEENNTVYTIMEFVNNSNVEHYLEGGINKEEKDEIVLPPIEEHNKKESIAKQEGVEIEESVSKKEEKKPKSYLFLKILSVSVLIMLGLAYYSWNMIKEDKRRAREQHVSVVAEIERPALNDVDEQNKESIKKEEPKSEDKKEEPKLDEKKERPFNASYIEEGEQKSDTQKSDVKKVDDEKSDIEKDVFDIPNEEVYADEEDVKVTVNEETKVEDEPKIEVKEPEEVDIELEESKVVAKEPEESQFDIKELGEPISSVKEKNSNSLGTQVGGENTTERFNRMSVKRFLDKFIASSTSGTIDDIVSNYDSKVDRYFGLKNVNQSQIRKDKVNYQKKWTKRDFRLVAFKIISIYRKGNFDYCDISMTTQWTVSSDDFKTSAGRSKGRMTLKRTYDGFKVTSIYTVK